MYCILSISGVCVAGGGGGVWMHLDANNDQYARYTNEVAVW